MQPSDHTVAIFLDTGLADSVDLLKIRFGPYVPFGDFRKLFVREDQVNGHTLLLGNLLTQFLRAQIRLEIVVIQHVAIVNARSAA